VVLGQIAQETGWGAHVQGNNIFGISPGGKVANYPTVQDAAQAYIGLIKSRYPAATAAPTPDAQAHALAAGGYGPSLPNGTPDPAYGTSVAQLASQVRGATPSPPDPDFATRWGIAAPGNSNTPAPAVPDPDFNSRWGIAPTPGASPYQTVPTHDVAAGASSNLSDADLATLQAQVAKDRAAAAAPSTAGPAATAPAIPDSSWDTAPGLPQLHPLAQQPPAAPQSAPTNANPLSYQGLTNDLAPAPNTTYGNVFPLARDNTTGALRLALPTAWRDLAQGGLDLLNGPATGTVTPKATMTLGTMAGELLPSVARGSAWPAVAGATQAPTATVRPTPSILSSEFRANPGVTTSSIPPGPMQTNAPLVAGQPLAASSRPAPNPLQAGAQPPSAAPPSVFAPTSVGAAATPSNLTPLGAREALASRSTGEIQRVLQPAKAGIDTTIYVPGTKPTEAEVSGSPSVAFDQKLNRQQNPDPHIAQEKANNDARVEYYDQTAGTPTQVLRLKEARAEQATKDLATAFGNKQPTDAQPVVDTLNGILNDPRLKESDDIQKYIAPLVDRLKNADGTLKSDPETFYGVRENIARMQGKAAISEKPTIGNVKGQLQEIKDTLDGVIEKGAPGYRQYLDNYSTASRPIDAMEYLQEARPGLTNSSGTMTPAAFDRFMKNTVSDRSAGGIQPAGSLTDDQMEVLHNLHSDLKRLGNLNLSNPRSGSDTSMLLHGVKAAGNLALHGVANKVAPVLGSIGVQMGKNALQNRAMTKMTQRVLNPNPLQYPPSAP
jgi:hypothetical protein